MKEPTVVGFSNLHLQILIQPILILSSYNKMIEDMLYN